jgi:cell division protein FtsB
VGAFKRIIPSFFLAVSIAYFGYHAFTGDQGVLNWIVVETEISAVEAELEQARGEREALEITAGRLRSDSLDLDYVDERARAILNVAHPDDFVVRLEDPADR